MAHDVMKWREFDNLTDAQTYVDLVNVDMSFNTSGGKSYTKARKNLTSSKYVVKICQICVDNLTAAEVLELKTLEQARTLGYFPQPRNFT